jgi:uncharacterized protein (DUF302 family)
MTSIIEHQSRLGAPETLDRLVRAIEDAGMSSFARIDHAAGARAIGLEMPAATVLIYGNARGGTPIMQAYPAAALDLPLRVLVRASEGGGSVVSFHPIAELLASAGVPADLAGRLAQAQALLVEALA